MKRILFRCLLSLCSAFGVAFAADNPPSVALFYGANPPLAELHAFDVAVVDPDTPNLDPVAYKRKDSELFAYVSVGEVRPERPYFAQMPRQWLKGSNSAWASHVVDQADPEWPRFFATHVIAPLWAKGYRGFFLDTLDSYQLIAKTPEERARQEAGLKNVIRELKRRWPEARLIFNRGFEILPEVHDLAWMVAAESLYQSWDAGARQFRDVPANDQAWLRNQFKVIREQYRLPVLVIDYVPAKQRQLARDVAAKIRADGYIPWVSTPELDLLGVGNVEVMPRKVLMVYNPAESASVDFADGTRFLSAPLAYLGFSIEYMPYNGNLPAQPLTGRYAGIISWINDDDVTVNTAYPRWLSQQLDAGIPYVAFSRFGLGNDTGMLEKLGLTYQGLDPSDTLEISHKDPMLGFELPVRVRRSEMYPVVAMKDKGKDITPLLTLTTGDKRDYPLAALTPWGGYVLGPYTVEVLPGGETSGSRWVINPLEFLQKALRLDPNRPIPDITTENGRRLLMVHIDGDGFVSKAERPKYPYDGEVMLNEVLKRYPVPTTVSMIEGEVGPTGLYPDQSPQLEAIARDIYALPWVELASHSYSHPFFWDRAERDPDEVTVSKGKSVATANLKDELVHLPIQGYKYNVAREIGGSIDYINTRLAPPDKKVKVMLWSGKCVSTPKALTEAAKAGVLNMNGGDTDITRSQNTWTRIAGLGVPRGDHFQVYAPNQNENIYTNEWTGPFYGFERVIETFQLTDAPYRFKPINIYYHSYIVSKTASLNSLHKVYQWALKQPVFPVYSSEYIQKVLDFNTFVVARTPTGYRLRGNGHVRTIRLGSGTPNIDLARSPAVAGYAPINQQTYVHLLSSDADLVTQTSTSPLPYIESTNASITQFVRTQNNIQFALKGYQPIVIGFANASNCQLMQGAKPLPGKRQGDHLHVEVNSNELTALQLSCRA